MNRYHFFSSTENFERGIGKSGGRLADLAANPIEFDLEPDTLDDDYPDDSLDHLDDGEGVQ